MQAVQLLLISVGLLLAVAIVAARLDALELVEHRGPKVLLGIVPGVIGAVLILVERLDVIPDEAEGDLWAMAMIAISTVAILGTSVRLARR
ncbi:MAG: hypothetical protein WEG56_01410 [Chloroflexota bacterium]